jgi:homoserine dehydrogenase
VRELAEAPAAPYYLRFTVRDRPGIIAALAAILAARDINIDAILQEPGFASSARPFVVTIDPAPAAAVEGALDDIRAHDFHVADPLALPMVTAAVAEVVA